MATSSHNRRKAQKKADRKAEKKAERKAEKKAERKVEKKAERRLQKKLTKLANRKRRSNRKINRRPSSGFFNFIKKNKLLVIATVVLLIIVLILVFAVVLPNMKKNNAGQSRAEKEESECGQGEYLNKEGNGCLPCNTPKCDGTKFYDPNNPPYCRDTEFDPDNDEKTYPCQPCPTCNDGKPVKQCGGGPYDINNKDTSGVCDRQTSDDTSKPEALSGGAIAAIVAGIIIVLFAIVLFSLPDNLFGMKARKKPTNGQLNKTTAVYQASNAAAANQAAAAAAANAAAAAPGTPTAKPRSQRSLRPKPRPRSQRSLRPKPRPRSQRSMMPLWQGPITDARNNRDNRKAANNAAATTLQAVFRGKKGRKQAEDQRAAQRAANQAAAQRAANQAAAQNAAAQRAANQAPPQKATGFFGIGFGPF